MFCLACIGNLTVKKKNPLCIYQVRSLHFHMGTYQLEYLAVRAHVDGLQMARVPLTAFSLHNDACKRD